MTKNSNFLIDFTINAADNIRETNAENLNSALSKKLVEMQELFKSTPDLRIKIVFQP